MDNNQQQNGKQPTEKTNARNTVKSITNINYDCLARIYDFLDLENLLNVANTCRRLQIAAAAYFGDVHGKKTVALRVRAEIRAGLGAGIRSNYNINVVDLKFGLPFLRCFGAKILGLNVDYLESGTDDIDYVDRYIDQYCAKTLKILTFLNNSEFSIEKFQNPFECVETVHIYAASLGKQLPYFVALFPCLRDLTFRFVSVDENWASAVQFTKLENLSISIPLRSTKFPNYLGTLLHANPQLQEFELNGRKVTFNTLLYAIKGNPSITKLVFRNCITSNTNQADLMQFASEHPFMVELDFGCQIAPQDAIIFIRQLKSLKIFRFRINSQTGYDQLVSQLDSEWKHENVEWKHGYRSINLTR